VVADNLKRQWFWVVGLGIRDWLHKATWEACPDYLTGITTIILLILTTKHLWGNHLTAKTAQEDGYRFGSFNLW